RRARTRPWSAAATATARPAPHCATGGRRGACPPTGGRIARPDAVRVPSRRHVGERLTVFSYRPAAALPQGLPFPMGSRLAYFGGNVSRWVHTDWRPLVARHQRRAGTRLTTKAAVEGAFDSYARYWYELLRLPKDVRDGEIEPHFSIKGYEHITD